MVRQRLRVLSLAVSLGRDARSMHIFPDALGREILKEAALRRIVAPADRAGLAVPDHAGRRLFEGAFLAHGRGRPAGRSGAGSYSHRYHGPVAVSHDIALHAPHSG